MSGQLITVADIEKFGWVKSGDKFYCPFCSGQEDKLKAGFEAGTTSQL